MTTKILEFNNWTDLQTQQIVLMPRFEEHGAFLSLTADESYELHQINDTNVYDWSLEDIIVLLKEQEPIQLHVSGVNTVTETKSKNSPSNENNEIEIIEEEHEEKKDCDDSLLNITLPFSPMSELSSWTKRVVSETSKQVHKYKQQQQQKQQQAPLRVVSLFIQSNTGAFLSLNKNNEITNTSLLVLRKSATEPAGKDVSCQWYASTNMDTNNSDWRPLPGATHTAFQPSADLAGHFLRCRVQIADDDATLTCDTQHKVQLVPTLFQGIRQATQKMSGYSSICMIKDTTLRFTITNTAESRSAMRVEHVLPDHSTQVLHEQLVGVRLSLASYDTPKEFQMYLPISDDNSDSLLYRLADEKRIVNCQALNRLGRESFLIAFGITNCDGSSLSPSMLLYPALCNRESSSVEPLTSSTAVTSSLSKSTVASEHSTRSITPPRSPIPFQRSTSLDTRVHSPNTQQQQQQILELQRQNAELQKQNKQWLNEKAVLQAAIDARENKLEHAQEELAHMRLQLEAQQRNDNEQKDRRIVALQATVEQLQKELRDKDSLIATVQTECNALEEKYQKGQTVVEAHQQEHSALTMKLQKLKAERCHFKQKNESLQKEIAVICKNGRTIRQVEKLIADDAARQHEVMLLRKQKKEALTELEHYRTAYQETKHAQKMAGLDVDVTRLFERNAELERLVGELTEFVQAKESQLETVKQVNEALQAEIHSLAQAHMSNNDV